MKNLLMRHKRIGLLLGSCLLPVQHAFASMQQNFILFAQEDTQAADWSMTDAFIVVVLILVALIAICKSSQRH